jgi:thiamine biosynthesis lipoprotein ApbE
MKIKPCPFCGGKAELLESEPSTARFNEGAVHFAVSCGSIDCGVLPKANLWQITPEEAVQAWNKRPSEQTLTELLENLHKKLIAQGKRYGASTLRSKVEGLING